ncbi:MAG TPA: type II secretion system protein [Pantanalinema sp.]
MGKQRGFTIIEVTLAIAIGVVMLAGASALYRQVREAAGNARAQDKVLRIAGVIETYAAGNKGFYPTLSELQAAWYATAPDDLGSSPWGGLSGKPGSLPDPIAQRGIVSAPGWPATPWTIDASRDITLQGFTGYGLNTPGASQSATDIFSGRTRVYRQYVVGAWNSHGEGPFFPIGH